MLESPSGIWFFICGIGRAWYTSCAIVLVLCFVGLCAIWVNLVPTFQSPDEPDHFDYAFSLASAGRLLRASDGPAGHDPRVDLLQSAAQTSRLAFHNDERVARDYGSPAYFTAERARQEPYASYSPLRPGAVRSTLTSVYPFVPYAAYAAFIYAFRSDVFSALFAARFANVLFGAIGLLVWSRILLRLHLRKIDALATIAIVAFFPLSAFVCSYVQPDGFTFFLVALLFAVTLRIRDGATDLSHGLAYAVLLSLLAGSKLQYFIAAGVATLATIGIAYARREARPGTKAIVLAAILTLVTGMLFLTLDISHSSNANYFQGPHTMTSGLSDTIKNHHFGALIAETRHAFVDLFIDGTSSRSFWGIFGWLDTPLRIHDASTTEFSTTAEIVGTQIVLVMVSLTVLFGIARIARVARSQSFLEALRLATNDPLLNTYVVFALLILALYVSSNDLFAAQGRNWFGLEVIAVLGATWYAPRLLPRALRRPWQIFAFVVFGCFSAISSASAITTLEDRYYRPLAPVSEPNLRGVPFDPRIASVTIDQVSTDGLTRPVIQNVPLALRSRSELSVRGWAYDASLDAPCSGVYDTIDGKFDNWAIYGIARPDVAAQLHVADLESVGYRATVSATRLRSGNHAVGFVCVGARDALRFGLEDAFEIRVAS